MDQFTRVRFPSLAPIGDMGDMTIQKIARRFKERLDIDIPHPTSETFHGAEFLKLELLCKRCPIDCECSVCDSLVERLLKDRRIGNATRL